MHTRAQAFGRLGRRRLQPSSRRHVIVNVRNIDWPEALFFDCDGVLIDTEKDGHRVAFNRAFQQQGLPHQWDIEKYGELLEIGGGKERMCKYFTDCADQEPFKSIRDPEEQKAFLIEMHKLKTGIFQEIIESGAMPLRPGVKNLIETAIASGVKVGVCSTSNEKAVQSIVDVMLGPDISKVMRVFAGDMVPAKKPDPAIYNIAAVAYGVDPARCVVIEDSRIGLRAAKAAGMRCIITKSSYTEEEDFDIADAVFDCIGEAGDERFTVHDLTTPGKFFT